VKGENNNLGSWSVFDLSFLIFSKNHLKNTTHTTTKKESKSALVTQALDAHDKHRGREDYRYYGCY